MYLRHYKKFISPNDGVQLGPEKNTFRQNSLSIYGSIDTITTTLQGAMLSAHFAQSTELGHPTPSPVSGCCSPALWIRKGRSYPCLAIFCLICFLDKVRKNLFHNQPLSRRPPFPVLDRGEAVGGWIAVPLLGTYTNICRGTVWRT